MPEESPNIIEKPWVVILTPYPRIERIVREDSENIYAKYSENQGFDMMWEKVH